MFCCQKYQIVQPRNPRPKTTMPINGTILDLSFSGFRMSREMRTAQIRKRYIPPNNTALQKRDWGETITARAVKIAAPAKLAKNQRISRICQLLTLRAFSRNRSSANNTEKSAPCAAWFTTSASGRVRVAGRAVGPQRPSPMGACTASIASGPPCPRECGGLCRPVERTASGPHPSARGGPRPCTWTVQLVQRTPSRTDRRASHRPMSVSRVERTASGASPVSAWRASPLHVDGAARPANAVTDRPSSASGRLHTLEVSSAFPPSDPGASEHSTKPKPAILARCCLIFTSIRIYSNVNV